MFSWQVRQMTRVFRRRMAMRRFHAGVGSTGMVEVGQFPDVMDLKVRPGLAKLTAFGQEPMNQLVAPSAGQDRSRNVPGTSLLTVGRPKLSNSNRS